MRRLPPLNGLRAFEATARHLSFTRAADELCVSQGAVSRHVRNLEDWLGVVLIHRTTRKLQLTEAGTALLASLSAALDQIAGTTATIMAQREELNLMVAPSFAMLWLMPRLQNRGEAIPVRLTTRAAPALFDADSFDAGILYGSGDWGDLHADLIMEEQLTPVCAAALLAGERPLTTIEDLQHQTLLHSSTDHRDWRLWLEAVGVSGIDTDQGVAFETMENALRAAESGHGVTIGDLSLIKADSLSSPLVRPFEQSIFSGYGYYFLCPPDAVEQPRIANFRNWLLDELLADNGSPR